MKSSGVGGGADPGPSTAVKVCSFCKKTGHTVNECYCFKNKQKREEAGGGAALRAPIRAVRVDEDVKSQTPVRMLSLAVNKVNKHEWDLGVLCVCKDNSIDLLLPR